MIFRKFTIILLEICAAGNLFLMSMGGIVQALPTPKYKIELADLQTHKYIEDHQHITPSLVLKPGPLVPNIYQEIQYAPLYGRLGKKNKNTPPEYTTVTSTPSYAPAETNLQTKGKIYWNVYWKDHLEPRVSTGGAGLDAQYKCDNPEHTGKILSSVSRSPGHNAVYRPIQVDKTFKKNYLKPYGVYDNLEQLTMTTMPFDLPLSSVGTPFHLPNNHDVPDPNNVEGESPVAEKIKRQYLQNAKLHRLHLNIARVYSPGQVPQKSPVFADTYAIGRLPLHSQAYIPPVFYPLPDQKTVLFPTQEEVYKKIRRH